MESILKSLEATSKRLNKTADRANDVIRAVNTRLEEAGVGVEYWSNARGEFALRSYVPSVEDAEDTEIGTDRIVQVDTVLGYSKLGTWQLVVHDEHYAEDDTAYGALKLVAVDGEIPLLSADREQRIKAVAELPAFLKAYTEHIEYLASQLPDEKALKAEVPQESKPRKASGAAKKSEDNNRGDDRVREHFSRRRQGRPTQSMKTINVQNNSPGSLG